MDNSYCLASSTWNESEYNAMQKVIDSGMFTMGKEVNSFEKAFAQFHNAKYALMVNSGSSANLLMIASLFYTNDKTKRLKAGDEVIVPAVSWSTTYSPLHQYGLKIKFVDIDLETLNYDLEALKKAISPQTKCILCVNLLGNPNNFDEIKTIAGKDIIILEDNCESLGAKYKGKYAGTFGLMGTYSSFFSHHISTMEGGLITTDDEELYHILLCLRAHGWTRHLPENNKLDQTKQEEPFYEYFRFILPGYNVRPGELNGALGTEQLKKLPAIIEERRKNAEIFQKLFADHELFYIQKEVGESSWFGFSLIIKENVSISRQTILKILSENNIEYRPIVAGNFTKNPTIEWFNYEIFEELKNADILDKNGFFIGNHHFCIEKQLLKLHSLLLPANLKVIK